MLVSMTSRSQTFASWLDRVARWMIVFVVILATLLGGLLIRQWAFDVTTPIRFMGDITRGFEWGQRCIEDGYFELYDIAGHQPADTQFWLDYAPLRLLVMNGWARINAIRYPSVTAYVNEYDFNRPVLLFNAAVEAINALGIFLLTRTWVRRCKPVVKLGGNLHGAIAALVVWFSPAMILSGSCWPTWDLWVIPFYVWAMFFAISDRWFLAGLAIGAGAMFKGQQLFVAPVFVLWPLFMGRPGAAMRWVAGLVFAIGVLASPWLVTYRAPGIPRRLIDWPAILFAVGVAIACGASALLTRIRPAWTERFSLTRSIGYCAAFGSGAALLCSMILFQGSTAWADCSWGFGTRHWETMVMGLTSNLPGILHHRYGWRNPREVLFTIQEHDVTMKTLLFAVFAVLMIVSCIGMAMNYRRKDTRFLVAIVTPWLLFFTIPAQIHERYLLYAAGVGAVLVGYGVGMSLLNFFLTLLTFAMTIHVMLIAGRRNEFGNGVYEGFGNDLFASIRATHPDIGWAVVLITLIFLYVTMTWPRKRDTLPLLADSGGDDDSSHTGGLQPAKAES